jgi:hypothetical protein
MDFRDEYVLTSSDEAFALGEQGRRLLLSMAESAFQKTLRAILSALREARQEQSWNDYEQQSVRNYVSGLSAAAYELMTRACRVSWDDPVFSGAAYRLRGRVSGEDELSHLVYFEPTQFDRRTRAILGQYRAAARGELAVTLRALYDATDPTIPLEYAETLLPALARKG